MNVKQYALATGRNREPIFQVLSEVLPQSSKVLEIASGTGEHAVYFASKLPSCHWIPSDVNPESRSSITAWKNDSAIDNLSLPLSIDVTQDNWQSGVAKEIDTIVNINMIHIAPWQACLGLMKGAGQILPSSGILYLYGPYKRDGEHTAVSNANFDRSLRERNPQWGVRDLEQVIEAADNADLKLQQVIEMPANNLSIIFSR